MIRLAVLADLHLPDTLNTLQWNVLDMALDCCRDENAHVLALVGDMIQVGARQAAVQLDERLKQSGFPVVSTPGNNEYDTPGVAEVFRWPTEARFDNVHIMSDNARPGCCSSCTPSSSCSDNDFTVMLGHWPPKTIPAGTSLYIAGHVHKDEDKGVLQIVRGLDPDKVIGNAPAVTFFDIDDNRVYRHERVLPGFSIDSWDMETRHELLRQIGVSIKSDCDNSLRLAASYGVSAVELLHSLTPSASALNEYISSTNGLISVHLPDVDPCKPNIAMDALQRGLDWGARQFTVHVPKTSIETWKDPRISDAFINSYCNLFSQAPDAVFGIENMHMTQGETATQRRYGYLPQEQLTFIAELQHRLKPIHIGAVLDIGHARNNAPFSKSFSISRWYEELRGSIVAMHIHQVVQVENGFDNHRPLTGWYTPLISLASFLHEWNLNRFSKAPIFIEIRKGDWEQSYAMFKQHLT